MVTKLTLKALLEKLIQMDGAFILQNPHGSMELRGTDFYLSDYNEWLTIYHRTPKNSESRSHLHLKWRTFQSACVVAEAGETPQISFFMSAEPIDEPCMIWYFPSFFDWAQGKAEIPSNIALYESFVQDYGMTLQFVEPESS